MDWKKAYRNALLDMSVNPPDIRKIVQPHIPSKLYKYGSFQSQFWEMVIFKGQIYFSSASEFNDPFDCRANLDYQRAMKKGKLRDIFLKRVPNTFFDNFPPKTV